jgi:hypothetical protein
MLHLSPLLPQKLTAAGLTVQHAPLPAEGGTPPHACIVPALHASFTEQKMPPLLN